MRKITSLTAFISFLLLLLNSIVLYIAPHGRIAYWADWRFLGLTKTEWINQHIIIGILFLLAIFLHAYYNWNLIVAYLQNKARQVRIFTPAFNIALLLVIVCTVGAYTEVTPFRWVLTLSESIKSKAALNYGEPPYGRAELSSLKSFASRMGLNLAETLAHLREAGIRVEDEQQSLLDIAKRNKVSPQQLYTGMKPSEHPGAGKAFSNPSGKGFGKRRLSDIAQERGLNVSAVIQTLAENGITAEPSETIRQIAEQNGIAPRDVLTAMGNTRPGDDPDD